MADTQSVGIAMSHLLPPKHHDERADGVPRPPAALSLLLHRAERWLHIEVASHRIAVSCVVCAATLAFVVGLDALTALSPVFLAVAAALLVVMVATLGVWTASAFCRKQNARATALTIERRASLPGNPLINALDLSTATEAQMAGQSVALRKRAVALGDKTARLIKARSVVDRTTLRRNALIALCTGALVLLSLWPLWEVHRAVLPRLLNPWSDHPPYTPLDFAVDFTPRQIHAGQAAVIDVRITGTTFTKPPSEADAVLLGNDGEQTRVPLGSTYSTGDAKESRSFTLRFSRVDRKMRFYINTPSGRSPTYTLPVLVAPPAEVHGTHDAATRETPPTRLATTNGETPDSRWNAWMNQVVELAASRDTLMTQLQDLLKQLDHSDNTQDAVSLNALLAATDQRATMYLQRAEELLLTGHAADTQPANLNDQRMKEAARILQWLEGQRDAVKRLRSALQLTRESSNTRQGQSDNDAKAVGGVGSAQAANDSSLIGDARTEIAKFGNAGSILGAAQNVDTTGTPPPPSVERIEHTTDTQRGGSANLSGVPPVYRDVTEAYFRRLAEDAQLYR